MDEGIKSLEDEDNEKETVNDKNPGTDFFVSQNSKDVAIKGPKPEKKTGTSDLDEDKSSSFFISGPENKR